MKRNVYVLVCESAYEFYPDMEIHTYSTKKDARKKFKELVAEFKFDEPDPDYIEEYDLKDCYYQRYLNGNYPYSHCVIFLEKHEVQFAK